MRGERQWPGGLAIMLFVLSACAPDAEHIAMRCELVNEPMRLVEGSMPQAHQLGRVGDALFVSWLEGHQWTGRWYDQETGTALTDSSDLGNGAIYRPMWINRDSRLEGFLITDPDGGPALPGFRYVGWWTVSPPPTSTDAQRTPITVNAPDACCNCVAISMSNSNAGPQGVLSVSAGSGEPVGVLVSALGSCPEDTFYHPPPPGLPQPYATQYRMHFLSRADPIARPLNWAPDPCDASELNPYTVSDPFVLQLDDSSVGVLYRPLGPGRPGRMQYVTARVDGALLSGPTVVGGEQELFFFVSGGHQPRAVRLGETILFTDGLSEADECSAIRMMNVDGSEPKDTPYQFPCRKDASRIVFWIEIGRLGDHAVLVWSERSRVDTVDVLATTRWDEAVWMALLSDKGQLASEPVRVTAPESTALEPTTRGATFGPFVDEFRVSLVAEGDLDPVVAWTDGRADGPGVYARTIHCDAISPGAE